MNKELIVSILSEALDLIRLESNWNKNCCARKDGEQCSPWDLHANRWTCIGAIEKVLIDRNMYRYLPQVAQLLEEEIAFPLLHLDYMTSHGEVVDVIIRTINRVKFSKRK